MEKSSWNDEFIITIYNHMDSCGREHSSITIFLVRDYNGIYLIYKNRTNQKHNTCDLNTEFAKLSKKKIFRSGSIINMNMNRNDILYNIPRYVNSNCRVLSKYLKKKEEEKHQIDKVKKNQKIQAENYEKAYQELDHVRAKFRNTYHNIPIWSESWALFRWRNELNGNQKIDTFLKSNECILLTRTKSGIIIGWIDDNDKCCETNIVTNINDVIYDLRICGEQNPKIPLLRKCNYGSQISMAHDSEYFLNALNNSGFYCFTMHDIIDAELKTRQIQREHDIKWKKIPRSFDIFGFSRALMFNIEIHRNQFDYDESPMITDLIAIDIARGNATHDDRAYYINKQTEEQQNREKIIKRKKREDERRDISRALIGGIAGMNYRLMR